MQVKQFIIQHGIAALAGLPIEHNGKEYKIVISDKEIESHSLACRQYRGSKEEMDRYHQKGSYRFYAKNEQDMCVWVYGSDEIKGIELTLDEISRNLCYYDKRNPDGSTDDDTIEGHYESLERETKRLGRRATCPCDNCYNGVTRLAEELLKIKSSIISNTTT